MMEKTINSITFVNILVVLASLVLGIFVPIQWVVILGTVILVLLGCIYNYAPDGDFSSMFSFMLILEAAFGGQLVISAFNVERFRISSVVLLWMTVIGFMVPLVFSIVMALQKRETERNFFSSFFINVLILFAFIYFVFLAFWVFVYYVTTNPDGLGTQFIPFATIAGYMDAVIKGIIPGTILAIYFAISIVVYIPYGFLMNALLFEAHTAIRVVSLLVMPIIVEVLQLIFSKNVCDIDDIIFGFVGGAFGMLLFRLLDMLFEARTGRGCTGVARL